MPDKVSEEYKARLKWFNTLVPVVQPVEKLHEEVLQNRALLIKLLQKHPKK